MSFIEKVVGPFQRAKAVINDAIDSIEIPEIGDKAYSAKDPAKLLGTVIDYEREDLPINPHGIPDRIAYLVIQDASDPTGSNTIRRQPVDVITETYAQRLTSDGVEEPNPVG